MRMGAQGVLKEQRTESKRLEGDEFSFAPLRRFHRNIVDSERLVRFFYSFDSEAIPLYT